MAELEPAVITGVRNFSRYAILLMMLTVIIPVEIASAQSDSIVLDGMFGDWFDQPNVPDPQGDAQNSHTDVSAFYFANNLDQDHLFFMVERWEPGSEGLDLRLNIDTNNNGNMSEAEDRMIDVRYHPNQGGRTYVDLYDGAGVFLYQIAYQVNWGEPAKGSRVEWGVTFSDLGIEPYQTIRMQLVSYSGNKISDQIGEVQWSPANALGWSLLIIIGALGLFWLYFQRRVIS